MTSIPHALRRHYKPGASTFCLMETPALLKRARELSREMSVAPSVQNMLNALADRIEGREPEDYYEDAA